MSLLTTRPRVAELVFQLHGRPLHPELFDILAERRLHQEGYSLRIWITRTGHVITFENADVLLTEVADIDQGFSDRRRFLSYRLRGGHNGRFNCCNDIVYQTSFQVETLPDAIFLKVSDEIRTDGTKRGYLHNFQQKHRFAVSPLGYVVVDATTHYLHYSTFHTFPDENAVVKSQTLIERARG